MFPTKYSTLLLLILVSIGVSSCGDKVETRPWQESFGTAVEFGFEDIDPEKGELQGSVILRGVKSPTDFKSFKVYWSSSANEGDKSDLLGQRSFANFTANPLLEIPQNTASKGMYFLLFISNGDKEQFTGKFLKIRDLDKTAPDPKAQVPAGETPAAPGTPGAIPQMSPMGSASSQYNPGNHKIHFSFDQSSISSQYRNQLEQAFIEYPELNEGKLVIVGHADERGSNAYNLALGQRRAQSIKNYLVQVIGIEKRNIKIISCGEEQPLDRKDSESAWAANRRAVTLQIESQSYDCALQPQF